MLRPILALILLIPSLAAAAELSRADVEAIVKDTLLNNPEIVVQSLKKYQEKQSAEADVKFKKAYGGQKRQLYADASSPVIGNPRGNVTLVEFFDYHCGYCKKMLPVMTRLTAEDKNLRVVFKEYPILAEDSETAAKAALAVWRIAPEKYFAYHTALMQMRGPFNEAALKAEAQKLGIDPDAMKLEMDKPAIAQALEKDRALAEALGVHGTPAFIVGGEIIGGATSYENLKQKLDAARKARG